MFKTLENVGSVANGESMTITVRTLNARQRRGQQRRRKMGNEVARKRESSKVSRARKCTLPIGSCLQMSVIRHTVARALRNVTCSGYINFSPGGFRRPFASQARPYKLRSRLLTNRARPVNEKRSAINNDANAASK